MQNERHNLALQKLQCNAEPARLAAWTGATSPGKYDWIGLWDLPDGVEMARLIAAAIRFMVSM